MLALTGFFVKGEVRRADELDALDPDVLPPAPVDEAAVVPVPVPVPAPPAPPEPAPVVTEAVPPVVVPSVRARRRAPRAAMPTRPEAAPVDAAPVDVAPVEAAPPIDPIPARRRPRSDARAERAAAIASLFSDDGATRTSDDDDRHLAALVAAVESGPSAAPGPVGRTYASLDAPGLDIPDPAPPRRPGRPSKARPDRRIPVG